MCTAQALMFAGADIPVEMVKFGGKLPCESVIDIFGELKKVEKPIESVSQSLAEIYIKKIFCVSAASSRLPFSVTDASRSDQEIADAETRGDKMATVSQDIRLDNRVMDLRVCLMKVENHMMNKIHNYLGHLLIPDYICVTLI